MKQSVRVEMGQRSYSIRIGALGESALGDAVAELRAPSAVIIGDATVAGLYGRWAIDSLRGAGVSATQLTFPAGEEHKTLATYGRLMDELLAISPAIDRDTVIVALGGGVSGDMAGFVAATALRGLRWVQCPTSLLADVDASVGGKTGVDTPAGKNLIGAFHQPRAVLINVTTLKTLPAAELRSGLAECVKHAAIADATLLDFLESRADAIFACDTDTMTELVTRNVAIKAAVVSADERESGIRAHLNFGHTIAHAIETSSGYGQISHGAAVALGMVGACHIAVARNLIPQSYADRIELLLERLGLPTRVGTNTVGRALPAATSQDAARVLRAPNSGDKGGQCPPYPFDADAMLDIMQHDKKARAGKIRMILPAATGKVDIFDDVPTDEIVRALSYIKFDKMNTPK